MKKSILIKKRGHKCENCLNTHWLNELIPLEKHHVNPPSEKEKDLQLLCPNCHAMTKNYRGKGIKTVKNISDSEIKEHIKKSKNIRQLLINLNLVAKGGNYKVIKKRLKYLNLINLFQKKEKYTHCLNCGIEILKRYKFCSCKCGNEYNGYINKKTKIKWPSRNELKSMVNENGYSKTGRILGVSDNAVRKRLKL